MRNGSIDMPWYVPMLSIGIGFVAVIALRIWIGANVVAVLSYNTYYTRCEICRMFLEKRKPFVRYLYGEWFVFRVDELLNSLAQENIVQERYANRCDCEFEYKLSTGPRRRRPVPHPNSRPVVVTHK